MKNKKLPKFLKGCFWSVNFKELDVDKDKDYIIHQIFAFGDLEAIKWLFKTYGRETIRKVFIKKPAKIYRPQTFNWLKIILDLEKKRLNLNKYVINTPRDIR
jgi:hypothetical protein